MKIIYYKGSDPSKSRGCYTAVYNDFTGIYCDWCSDYNNPDNTIQLKSEELQNIIKNNNLKPLLSNEGLSKYYESYI